MIKAMWKHTCSNHYILAAVASLLIWIVATLAPGARKSPEMFLKEDSYLISWIVTINNVLVDGALMAFAVGAVPPQSVLKYVHRPLKLHIVHFGIF